MGEILGSNKANKEEKEGAAEEVETNNRRISTSVRKHHKDYQRAMA